jgi:hypothetical protein
MKGFHVQSFPSLLLEELHNHIYLKDQVAESRIQMMAKNPDYMQERLESLQTEQLQSDSQIVDGDPSQDSFTHMKSIIKSLYVLNALPESLKMLCDRISAEIQSVILRCIQETKVKPEYVDRFSSF